MKCDCPYGFPIERKFIEVTPTGFGWGVTILAIRESAR